MENILEIYRSELDLTDTRYFILDTKGIAQNYDDKEFSSYDWLPSRYNRVREGDLFIYRRPASSSEVRGLFYFFGAGRIHSITDIGAGRIRGYIDKPIKFDPFLLQTDLEEFPWEFKDKGPTWEHFFNQYGMNEIKKRDFTGLLKLGSSDKSDIHFEEKEESEEVKMYQDQQQGNYFVEDLASTQKVRKGQSVFSTQVKRNYGFKCALSGIENQSFLIGSHIIPWAANKSVRLDPSNGICLSVELDKAFDKGFITIDESYKVLISTEVNNYPNLKAKLDVYKDRKIKLPTKNPPRQDYLQWHRENIFRN
ncbi:putative restriction endonuclease [Sinobaca qinghaiensis]|uniref:Putative restriction endonuclease n=1 Tax=Sinobaca qinghaiensis TaxID=342944 RepID=A0A419V565_9BACL|nr:HNH endonuclease [Sinobaca qinghaiensis]RKD73659.1 putative restriction endonuclease [Sinobaca qinghaiensis]